MHDFISKLLKLAFPLFALAGIVCISLEQRPVAVESRLAMAAPMTAFRLTQRFRPQHNPKHDGLDLAGRSGTPISATGDGTVIYAQPNHGGYGKMVVIAHAGNWSTVYAHLREIKVRKGESVSAGQVIGYLGNSGRSSGPHLHFELRRDRLPVDPMRYTTCFE